jgi:hypothetical protein
MSAELDCANVTITASRLERWRREELLPAAKQIGLGRGRGSVVMVAPECVAQALELDRLYAVHRKREWVGWQLWMQGYWVGDQYWRPPMVQARAAFRDVTRQARSHLRRSESRDTDLTALKNRTRLLARRTPFAAPLSIIEEPMFEWLLGFGIEIVTGEFEGFSWKPSEADKDRRTVINLLGAANAERQSISGNRLEIANSIEEVLREISQALRRLMLRRSISEPSQEVRHEVAQTFEVGTALYDMLSPLFGRSAFGLRTINRIGLNQDIGVHSAILLVWNELRQFSTLLRPRNEIAELHGQTIKARQLASEFWSTLRGGVARKYGPDKKELPDPKRGQFNTKLR